MKKVVSKLFLLAGLLFISFGFYLVYLRHSPKLLSFEGKKTSVKYASGSNQPSKITIPSLRLNLPIVPAISDGRDWETTHLGVSYLSGSPVPGEQGNSVLYGHNWESLLSKLPQIKTGERIEITMQNGSKKSFVVEYTAVVTPDQTYIIENTSDTRMTLYTCTGFLYSKRFVVVAKPSV